MSTSQRQPVTERRKAAFLEALRQTGSLRWAAAIASPHLGGEPRPGGKARGFESFRDAMRRDPVFAAEVEEALSVALGTAEKLLAERMLTPDTRPIVDKNGAVVAVATDHRNANTLLLRFLERHSPDHWAPKKQLSGTVTHDHTHQHTLGPATPGYTITADDLLALPDDKRRLLVSILDEVEHNREQPEPVATVPALPAPEPHGADGDEDAGGPRD